MTALKHERDATVSMVQPTSNDTARGGVARAAASPVARLGPYAVALGILLSGAAPAVADYHVARGDVVEVTVRGFPELRQRVPVAADGTITLDQGGDVAVAGLSLSDLRQRIRQAMAATAFRQRAADGHDVAIALEPDEISAAIVEYRPIYVTGDVAKSGEQPYRMALTVRQAIAIAGGVDPAQSKGTGPTQVADLRAEERALWTQMAYAGARIWRLEGELGSKADFDRGAFAGSPLGDATLATILGNETTALRTWTAARARDQTFLKASLTKVQDTIDLVSRQMDDEGKGTAADVEDLQNVLQLMSKGNVTSGRVNDARRAVLLASTRKLQTASELLQLKRQEEDLNQQAAQQDDQRRIAALQELQSARNEREVARDKLIAVTTKLRLARTGAGGAVPTVSVFRTLASGEVRLDGAAQTELEPGDVVEVTLPLPQIPSQ